MDMEQLAKAKGDLAEMLRLLGIGADIECTETEDGPRLVLQSSEAGRLIGRKGQNLESLELVMNRMQRLQGDDAAKWIKIEVDGYVASRPEPRHGRGGHPDVSRMESIARDAAKEVKRWGDPKVIGPFKPGERRIVHMTLRDDPDVETISDDVADANGCKMMTIRRIAK